MSPLPPLIHLAGLSGYSLFLSYQAITRLQQYERRSEKAAEWSNTAAERLHKTRTTQASGAITEALSLITSLTFLLPAFRTKEALIAVSLVNTAILAAARLHMGNFWNEQNQVRVPFVERFNEAIRGSETLVKVLGILATSWATAGTVWWSGLGGLWGNVVYFGITSGVTFVTGFVSGR